jgi:hypothetical protein
VKKLIGLAIVSCLFSGCATVNHMAFDRNSKTIDTTDKSILLMTLDVSRADDSRYIPNPSSIFIEASNAQQQKDRQMFKLSRPDDFVQVSGHDVYLARMAIKPGDYQLHGVMGYATGFPFVGTFYVPLRLNVDVKPNSVTYIGRVTAKLRPRKDGEFRAGPLIPLIDQAATGLSTGTWDVEVDDKSQEDLPMFKINFPAVVNSTIENKILPPFDREVVQKWSDNSVTPDK